LIDVWQVASNALWVLGLSVLLATWSFARYEAHMAGVKTREKFAELGYALVLNAGLLLFIAGMAATERRWWARGLWVLLGIGIVVDSVLRVRQERAAAAQSSTQDADRTPPRDSGPGQVQVTAPDQPSMSDKPETPNGKAGVSNHDTA
jgi:hypothetical protein